MVNIPRKEVKAGRDMKLNVNLGEKSYEIFIERGVLRRAADLIAEVFHGKKIMIISDDRVYGYYGEVLKEQLQTKWECYEAVVPHGEASKSMAILPAGKTFQERSHRSARRGSGRRYGWIRSCDLSARDSLHTDSYISFGSGGFFRRREGGG